MFESPSTLNYLTSSWVGWFLPCHLQSKDLRFRSEGLKSFVFVFETPYFFSVVAVDIKFPCEHCIPHHFAKFKMADNSCAKPGFTPYQLFSSLIQLLKRRRLALEREGHFFCHNFGWTLVMSVRLALWFCFNFC